jgi:hypothetical protein
MRQAALALAAIAVCSSALAAADPGRTAGDWRLSEVGGKVACTLTLTRETSLTGFALKAPLACRRAFPALKSVAAWTLDDKGGIVLTDSNAQTIVIFPAAAQAGGPYEAKSPDGRTWRLEPLKSDATPPSPTPATAKPAT